LDYRIKKTVGLLTQVPTENPKKPNEKLLPRWSHIDQLSTPLIFYTPNTNYFTNFIIMLSKRILQKFEFILNEIWVKNRRTAYADSGGKPQKTK
jgi:hypothetical protein